MTGQSIDLVALGEDVWVEIANGVYKKAHGTSLAAPYTAAAIVKEMLSSNKSASDQVSGLCYFSHVRLSGIVCRIHYLAFQLGHAT
jgi:hypothetical protein